MKIKYEINNMNHVTVFSDQEDKSIYLQTDTDVLSFAGAIGAPVHLNDIDNDFHSNYERAIDYLELNEGNEFLDPGYFA
jgi:hypothetical protein